MANKMDETVEELKKVVPFKDTTEVGDVILIVNETSEEDVPLGMAYARVNEFERDPAKREEWWFVHMTFLTVPPHHQTLILQSHHFTGQEIFTIGGKKVFIKALDFESYRKADEEEAPQSEDPLKTEEAPESEEPPQSKEKSKANRGGLRVVK